MTLHEFNQLSFSQKMDFIVEGSLFLLEHKKGNKCRSSLYYRRAPCFRNEFFIEVLIQTNGVTIDSINAFQTTKPLEKYLDGIRMSGIQPTAD